MKKHFILTFLISLCVTSVIAADFSIRLPVSAVITNSDNSGKTWKQNGYIPITYVTAVTQMSACLRGQGWKEIQYIGMGKDKSRCIMVWQRGKKKITVMIWKVLVDQSGFSWGINHDK